MTRAELIQFINANIYPNGRNQITAPMVRDSILAVVGFLGDAAVKDIGAVLENNTDLVTGGSVYSAINEAVSSVMKMQGTTTTPLSDGSTTNPVVIDGSSYTAKKGDVVLYDGKEYLWAGSAWEQLGDEASWALKTTSISAGTGLEGGGTLAANRTISLSAASIASLALADSAYQKPSTGIPQTDLASALSTKIDHGESAYTNLNDWFEIVDGNIHVKGNRGFYSDSFISAGGLSSDGGSGGIDPEAMWQLLGDSTNEQIAASHLTTALNGYATQSWVTGRGYITGITSSMVTNALGYTPANVTALDSYVLKAGDTMTGTLTAPRLRLTGVGSSSPGGLYPANEISGGLPSTDLFIYNSGEVDIYGTLINLRGTTVLSNNTYFSIYDTGGTARGVLWLTENDLLDFGRFTAQAGYNTAIYGANISFYYGTSNTLGLSITSGVGIITSNLFYGPVFRTSTSSSDTSGVWRGSVWSTSLGDGDMVVSAYGHSLQLVGTTIGLFSPSSLYRNDLNGHDYTIWDANNSNNRSVAWACSYLEGNDIRVTNEYGIGRASSFIGGSETGAMAYVYGNNPFKIWTNGYLRMTIAGDGGVSIGGQFTSTYSSGAPFVVASNTLVSNLNADLLDGYEANAMFKFQGFWDSTDSTRADNAGGGMVFGYAGDGLPIGSGVLATFSPSESASYQTQLYGCGSSSSLWYRVNSADIGKGNWYQLWDGRANAYFEAQEYAQIGQKWSTDDSNVYSYIRFIGYNHPYRTTRGLGIEYIAGSWTSAGNAAVHRFIVTQDVVALAICNDGTVGVGTTSPAQKLHVEGGVYASNGYRTATSEPLGLFKGSDITGALTANDGGLNYYGHTLGVWANVFLVYANIDATGTIHSSTGIWSEGYVSAGGLASSSDERLKSGIKDFGYSAEMLMALRPREWDWNEKSYMKGHAAGVVAQELQQVMPYAIVERQYLSVNYDMLHGLEIAGLQDHETRIRQLERENAELKRRLNMN